MNSIDFGVFTKLTKGLGHSFETKVIAVKKQPNKVSQINKDALKQL